MSDLTTAMAAAAEGCRAAAWPTIMAAGAQPCDDVPFWALKAGAVVVFPVCWASIARNRC